MAIVYKQKFRVSELVSLLPKDKKRVLLAEAVEVLARIYHLHFQKADMDLNWVKTKAALKAELFGGNYDLLVCGLNIFRDTQEALEFFKEKDKQNILTPSLTVSFEMPATEAGRLMDYGVLGHIDRRFSKPTDIIIIAKNILNY